MTSSPGGRIPICGNLPLAPGLRAVREELDRRNLRIPIAGPGWTDLPALAPSRIDFDAWIGAFDLHSYNAVFDSMMGFFNLSEAERRMTNWAE